MKKIKVGMDKLKKMHKYAEKFLECIEEVMDENMGERRDDDDDDEEDDDDEDWVMMGQRGGQGGSGGMRMGERRSRGRNGRYR